MRKARLKKLRTTAVPPFRTNITQKAKAASPSAFHHSEIGHSRKVGQILHLQRTLGNRATSRLLSESANLWAATLQRQQVPPKRTFTPTKFPDNQALIAALLKSQITDEDFAGACNFLSALTTAQTLALTQQIANRSPSSLGNLQIWASRGYATSAVRLALAAVSLKGKMSLVSFAVEHDSDLQALSDTDAILILQALGRVLPEFESMWKASGFKALSPEERTRLSYLIGGSTSPSELAPAELRKVLADRHANKDDPETFRKFLAAGKYLQFGPALGKVRAAYPFTIGTAVDVPNYAFGDVNGLAADALRYDVVIDGKDAAGKGVQQKIPVFIPKSAGVKDKTIQRPSIDEVAAILASLPDVSRRKIVRVDVHWLPKSTSPEGGGKPREGIEVVAAAGSDGVVNIYPHKLEVHNRRKLSASLIHETGHTASLSAWGDSDDKRWDPWRAAMKSDGFVPSIYAKDSIDEDFAESWALYVPAVGTPQENEVRGLMPARCKLMDTLLW